MLRNSDLRPCVELLKQAFGMRVLRHEENAEPCAITCNGRYNNAGSKTMIGYDTEDKGYCLEVPARASQDCSCRHSASHSLGDETPFSAPLALAMNGPPGPP